MVPSDVQFCSAVIMLQPGGKFRIRMALKWDVRFRDDLWSLVACQFPDEVNVQFAVFMVIKQGRASPMFFDYNF